MSEKTRCYVIADAYAWKVLTDNISDFYDQASVYLEVMEKSKKENTYFFKNVFLDEEEYRHAIRNMERKAKPKLRVVEEE